MKTMEEEIKLATLEKNIFDHPDQSMLIDVFYYFGQSRQKRHKSQKLLLNELYRNSTVDSELDGRTEVIFKRMSMSILECLYLLSLSAYQDSNARNHLYNIPIEKFFLQVKNCQFGR